MKILQSICGLSRFFHVSFSRISYRMHTACGGNESSSRSYMGHGSDPSRSNRNSNRRLGSDNDSDDNQREMNPRQTPNDSPDGENSDHGEDGGDGSGPMNPSRTPNESLDGVENGYHDGGDGGDGPGPSGTGEHFAQTVCHKTSFTLKIPPGSDSECFLRFQTCLKAGDRVILMKNIANLTQFFPDPNPRVGTNVRNSIDPAIDSHVRIEIESGDGDALSVDYSMSSIQCFTRNKKDPFLQNCR
jgi:hypothetical protein